LNGKPLKNQWLYNDQITGGGKLMVEMGKEVNKGFWGSKE
jgi:putative alpha-1,2-mannosidase